MFEKEAEELIEESKRLNTTPRETVRKAIDFGFQKGVKESANINVTFSDCPIKKQWHKIADNDFPTEEKEYLLKFKSGIITVMTVALDGNLEPYILTPHYNFYEDVEKWCEIPEEE